MELPSDIETSLISTERISTIQGPRFKVSMDSIVCTPYDAKEMLKCKTAA